MSYIKFPNILQVLKEIHGESMNKFKVGDRVRFLGAEAGGVETEIWIIGVEGVVCQLNWTSDSILVRVDGSGMCSNYTKSFELVANGTPLTNEELEHDLYCFCAECIVPAINVEGVIKPRVGSAVISKTNECLCQDLLKGHMSDCAYLLSKGNK